MSKLDYLKLKEKRNELDITQKDISKLLNIELNSYKKMEKGLLIPKKNEIKKICDFLKLDINSVYDEHFKNTVTLSFLNNKGGSGKTSISGSLAYSLSELGYKILCIDADMQGNLTHSFNLESSNEKNLAKAIEEEDDLLNNIIKSDYDNIDFVTYHPALSAIEMIMFNKNAREEVLKRILNNILEKGIYDFIIIDTNPTLSMLNFNIVNVSNYCISPLQLGAFGLEGLDILLNFIKGVIRFNPNFKEVKLVINNYDVRKEITKTTEEWLRKNYGDMLFKTIIRVDTNIEKAQLEGQPVLHFDTKSRISNEIRELAKEVVLLTDKEL